MKKENISEFICQNISKLPLSYSVVNVVNSRKANKHSKTISLKQKFLIIPFYKSISRF